MSPVIDLSAYKPVPATLGDANQIASGFQLIQSILNGIDNANFAAGKIFDPAKLMQNGAAQGNALLWDAASSTWKPSSIGAIAADETLVDIVSSVTETDLIGVAGTGIAIAGGTLSTNRRLRITVLADLLNNTGAANGFTMKIYYGGTGVAGQIVNPASAANRGIVLMTFYVAAQTATNAQVIMGRSWGGFDRELPLSGASGLVAGNTAIDSTVNQNLRVTATLSGSSASLEFRKRDIFVEVI